MSQRLTDKQKQVLLAIKSIQNEKGSPPTYKELVDQMDYSKASSVQRHVEALKDMGVLENKRGIALSSVSETVQIPLVGNVPCGQPLLAIENVEAYVAYPKSKISGSSEDYFFLRGNGDSMNDSDIHGKSIDDGDFILVRKQPTANPGDRVVALIGDDATVKKFVPGQNNIQLEPESTNTRNKPIIIFDDTLSIQGVVVDVIKKGGENG